MLSKPDIHRNSFDRKVGPGVFHCSLMFATCAFAVATLTLWHVLPLHVRLNKYIKIACNAVDVFL